MKLTLTIPDQRHPVHTTANKNVNLSYIRNSRLADATPLRSGFLLSLFRALRTSLRASLMPQQPSPITPVKNPTTKNPSGVSNSLENVPASFEPTIVPMSPSIAITPAPLATVTDRKTREIACDAELLADSIWATASSKCLNSSSFSALSISSIFPLFTGLKPGRGPRCVNTSSRALRALLTKTGRLRPARHCARSGHITGNFHYGVTLKI